MLSNVPVDLKGNELRRAKVQGVASDPSLAAGDAGRVWFNTADTKLKVWNGSAVERLTNVLETLSSSTSPLKVGAVDGSKNIALSLDAASASLPGYMSSAHYNLLANASASNNASALVARDASGNFSAGTISANLTGTATNATNLGGQSLTQVRDFSQTSGTRDHNAISDFDTQVRLSRLDQLATPTGPVAFGSQRLTGLADPVNPQDASTKNYVDSVATGLDTKASVKAATTGALPGYTYSNGSSGAGATMTATSNGAFPALDTTYTPSTGDRILVKNETGNPAYNGIYVLTQAGSGAAPWVLTRATDADTSAELTPGSFTFVEGGQTLVGSGWVVNTTTNPIVIGSTAITWAQFSGGQAYTAGNGLNLAGSAFVVVGTANRIAVSSSGVDIASTYLGQTSITTLGTIGTGVWNGTAVGVAYGGTGSATAAGARANLGAAGSATVASVGAIAAGGTLAITNPLGTGNCMAQMINTSTNDVEVFDINITAANITITNGATAVASGAYRLVIVG